MEPGVLKPREQRQKVMIAARMRVGATWHDACILNLSPRGLGLQAADPPPRGTYVEICRGRHAIVARVIWARGHRAGLRAQDPIWIEGLIAQQKPDQRAANPALGHSLTERRHAPRATTHRHDVSRVKARAIEFACIAVAGAGICLATVGVVQKAMAQPLSQIRSALGEQL